MKINFFQDLPVIDNVNMNANLKVGDRFLYGQKIAQQQENKKVGDIVTFYRVIKVKENGNVEYIPVYEKLEE